MRRSLIASGSTRALNRTTGRTLEILRDTPLVELAMFSECGVPFLIGESMQVVAISLAKMSSKSTLDPPSLLSLKPSVPALIV